MIKYHIKTSLELLSGFVAQLVDPPTGGLLSDMKYFVYVIRNNYNNKTYIGQTSNLKNRLDRHNCLLKNKTTSFTSKNKSFGLWKIIHSEEFKTRKEAIIREKQLKSYQGRLFIKSLGL